MSVSGKLVLAIKMFLESGQYKTELAAATKETEAAAARIEAAHTTTAKAATDAADKQIAALKKQSDTFGLSAAELRRYQASMVDASESQRAEINKLLENLEALEAKSASNASGFARMAAQWSAAGAGAKVAAAGTAFLVVAAAAVGLAYLQAGQETLAFEKAIILTGNRAGVTSGQLADMARNIDGIAGTQANASAALAAITASGQVTRDNLQKVGLAAVEMERATGQSIGETAKIFADLGKEPVKASLRLNESMNYLTAGTYEQIKAAEELGDKETAASIAQNAAADALQQRAAGVEQNLGLVERAWRAAGDMAKWAWDRFVDIGRAQTADQQLKALQKQIAEKENQLATTGFGENAGGAAFGRPSTAAQDRLKADIAALGARAAALQGEAYQASEAANAERERAAAVKASIALSDEAGKRDSALEKTRKAVAQATQQYTTAIKNEGLTQQERAQIDANYLKVVSDLTKVKEKSAGASKAAASDAEKLAKAGAALTDSLLAQDSGLSGDFAKKWESLNAAYRAGEKSVEELTAAQAKLLSQQPLMKQAADEEAKATKELEKEREKALATLDKDLEKTLAAVAAQEEQNTRLGLSKEAIAELDAAKLEMLATDMELQASNALFLNQDGEIYLALIKQANAYRDLARAKREGGAKQAGIESAKEAEKASEKAADAWQKASDKINDTLTDALMRGFESGKDFAKNLRDTVINMFKTMVLRPVISAIVNPVAGAVTGMMGLSGAANAAAAPSGVDVVGAISNGMSMLNTGINSAVQGTFSKFALSETGKSLGLSMAGPDASGYNMLSGTGQQMSQALGVVGDTLAGYAMGSMARSLISNGYSAGKGMDTFQKAGIAVGSALGGPVAGAIIGAGAGVFNQLFGRKLKDSGIQGTFGGTAGFDGERYDFYKGGFFRSDKTKTSPLDQGTTDGLTQQFRAIQLSTGLMAETLGLASGAVASFTKDIKLSFKGLTEEQIQEKMAAEFTAIADEMAGQVLGLQTVTETIRTGVFGNKSVTRVTQVQSEYAKANETASQTLTRLATSLTTVNGAFDLLGVAMLDASLASGDMASRLIEQSGGGEAFAENLGTYYENFYDQAEKTAYVTGQVTAALASVGLQMPKTREEFRALVEGQIALGDSGTQAVAALLGVSGAFASVVPAGDVLSEAMKRLQSDTAGLQIDLLRAQGNTTGADAAQRTLDTAGLTAAEVAVYDYNQALRAQITALDAAATAAAQQAEIRAGFERQLLELQGDTAALRALDIAGMDAYNVSLFDQVRATEAAAQAEQELAAKRAQIAQERYGLETQLLQAQGNTAALRARELELIDPSNQPLQQQIWALQDMAQAAKLASDAERELIAARVQSAQEAYRAAQAATGGALDALSRSVDAQRTIYESARSAAADAAQEVKAVIDTIAGSIKDLYGEVDSTQRAGAAAGLDFVATALRNASATGYLPDAGDLGDAISTARAGMGAENYASQFEADRDRLVLAGNLSQLAELAEPQLTAAELAVKAAEDQLETLDSILRAAQGQVDAARGIATDVKTIPGALASLQAALAAETSAKAAQVQAQAATVPTVPPVAATAKSYFELYPDVAASYALNDYGMSQLEFSATHFAKYGIDEKRLFPGFAAGINRVPQDMLAQIHKDEAVIPARFNPFNPAAQRNNDNADMLIELRALRQQNERLEARLASIEESNSTMANLLDNVTEGGNAMRSEVMA